MLNSVVPPKFRAGAKSARHSNAVTGRAVPHYRAGCACRSRGPLGSELPRRCHAGALAAGGAPLCARRTARTFSVIAFCLFRSAYSSTLCRVLQALRPLRFMIRPGWTTCAYSLDTYRTAKLSRCQWQKQAKRSWGRRPNVRARCGVRRKFGQRQPFPPGVCEPPCGECMVRREILSPGTAQLRRILRMKQPKRSRGSGLPFSSAIPGAQKMQGTATIRGEEFLTCAAGRNGSPLNKLYGVRRLGPRNRNMHSLMLRPTSSMVSRSMPRPKPPWGGQPYWKNSR